MVSSSPFFMANTFGDESKGSKDRITPSHHLSAATSMRNHPPSAHIQSLAPLNHSHHHRSSSRGSPYNLPFPAVKNGRECSSEQEDEALHFESVYTAYRQYATFSRFARRGWQQRFYSLPHSQRQYLPPALGDPDCAEAKLREQVFKEAEIRNQFLLDTILRYAGVPTSQEVLPGKGLHQDSIPTWASEESIAKVASVIKSLARDWSEEGKPERDAAYGPILQALQTYLKISELDHDDDNNDDVITSPPQPLMHVRPIKVCVPGAGVGRLALEIRALGYEVQGNEFSSYMLLASNFILNGGAHLNMPFRISPFLMETRNLDLALNPAREIKIPDCDVMQMIQQRKLPYIPDFSMVAGDFVSIYSDEKHHEAWDCCVSCFFIDTAPSIIEYFLVIYKMLIPGGIFINFGPLLYHWYVV